MSVHELIKTALRNPTPVARVKSWHHDLLKIYRFGLDEQRRTFRYKCLGCFAEYVVDFTPHRFCPCCGMDYAEFD